MDKNPEKALNLIIHRILDDDLTFSLFTGLKIDGKDVPSSAFKAESGSLKLTIESSYIKTLSAGKHSLAAEFSDGKAETSIKVTESEKSAATGDDSNIAIWFVLTIACAVALVVLIMYMRKINASDR